jgi:acetyl esterase/lipase
MAAVVAAAVAATLAGQEPAPKKKGKAGGSGAKADATKSVPLERIRVPEGVTLLPDLAYRDGHERWKLDLAMPKAKAEAGRPRPAIVFVHGGGWRSGDKRSGYFLQGALEYAAKGYVTMTVNYRLTGTHPFPACVEDVRTAVRWLRENAAEYGVDPTRIGAYGNSAGAHLVLMLALADKPDPVLDGDAPYRGQSSAVQAVCAAAPPTDFTRMVGANAGRYREKGSLFYGPEETLAERVRQASPVTYARADAPPVLLIHGDADTTVRIEQSRVLEAALRQAGAKDVTLLTFAGVGHGVFMEKRAETHPAMEAFFRRTLRP